MANPTVFVVIPVFNRIDATLHCLGDLREQTFPKVRIVVIDGGSTDDTVTQLSPMRDVHLISDVGEQWWTGATWFGIEHTLQHGGDDDYVMLLNNDTRFGPEMVEVLVGESLRFDAAVAPIARAENGSVVNSGTWIDWSTYEITQRMVEPDEIEATWPVDVLEGRGSLVPLHAIRTAGNVDHERLPHYAGDYEFTLRLARHGCPLMMTNCTSIEVDWDLDVLLPLFATRFLRPNVVGAHQQALVRERAHPLQAHRPRRPTTRPTEAEGPSARSPIRLDQTTDPDRAMWWACTARP